MCFGASYAYLAGQDLNWDWRNYHDYLAYAWLSDRYNTDVVPSGIQTYFNPYPYIFPYILRHQLSLPIAAMLMGALQGINFWLLWILARQLVGDAATAGYRLALPIAALLIAVTGPLTLSEIGTSFADLWTAPLIIGGLLLIVLASEQRIYFILLGGLLIGAATGLKLTNASYAIGSIAAVLMARKPVQSIFLLAVGGMVGVVATEGRWAWFLWRTFGNPLYPYYNGIFRSPGSPAENLSDTRFLPQSLTEAIAYPWLWMTGDHRTAEVAFTDTRFALLFSLGLLVLGGFLAHRRQLLNRNQWQFTVFFVVSYAVWLSVFAIQRYAVVLEILAAGAIMMCMGQLVRSALALIGTVLLAALVGFSSQAANWGRESWDSAYRGIDLPPALLQPATYLLVNKPTAFIASSLPKSSHFVQLEDSDFMILPGSAAAQRFEEILANPGSGGLWAVKSGVGDFPQEKLRKHGLSIDYARGCLQRRTTPLTEVEFCPLKPTAGP